MNNKGVRKEQAKKKFAIHEEFRENEGRSEELFLVVLIILTDQSMANKCKGIGLHKLKDKEKNDSCLFDRLDNWTAGQLPGIEVPVHSTKDLTVSVIEQIQKMIRENSYEVKN